MSRFLSPLRYPGGKAKLAPYIKEIIKYNKLTNLAYIEPFCGGAGVALDLLFNNLVEEIHINDIDTSIYSFWYSVINHNDELCNMINNVEINMDEWYKQKEIQINKENEDHLKLGFSTFFLNRTNRSGIMGAGVIGGYEQKGNYKMDCRFNKIPLINRIKRIGEYKDKIHLYNLDTIDLLNKLDYISEYNKFIYLDPPYYEKGSKLYINFYKHDDHVELKEKISKLQDYWITTYDNQDEIKELYSHYRYQEYTLSYTLEKKYNGKEIIIFSDNLELVE